MAEFVYPPRWRQRPIAGDGSPLSEPFEVSVTELNSFQRCRRAWDFTSPSRQSLRANGRPNTALNVGSCIHYALAAQTLGKDPIDAVREYYAASRKKLEDEYYRQVGTGMSLSEQSGLDEELMMCLALIEAYFQRYGTENPIKPYKPIGSEITFRIPLDDELGIFLIGTVDEVAVDSDGHPVVVESKSYSRRPDRRNWRYAHQPYGYVTAIQYLTQSTVPCFLYNGIRKTSPTIPQVLKRGGVSRRWIDTTYEIYRDKVIEVHGGVPNQYLDILNRLKARDNSPENAFFTRFRVPVSQHAVERWWDTARVIAREMAFNPVVYPHFPWTGCSFCKVQDLCDAVESGDTNGFDYIVKNDYHHETTHTRQAKEYATPQNVKNVHDLTRFARAQELQPPLLDAATEVTLEDPA